MSPAAASPRRRIVDAPDAGTATMGRVTGRRMLRRVQSRHVENVERVLSAAATRAQHTVEDSVLVRVPPRAAVTIVVRWMQVWEHGELTFLSRVERLTVPYQESVGLTFDLQTAES